MFDLLGAVVMKHCRPQTNATSAEVDGVNIVSLRAV